MTRGLFFEIDDGCSKALSILRLLKKGTDPFILGLFCNAYFYGSFGGINDFSGSYAIIGLSFDLAKFALVPVGVYFFMRAQTLEASLAGGAWLVLTIISLVAAFGFLSLKNSEYEATAIN